MTRSKNNWDYLVDYDGNYLPRTDTDSLQRKQLPMLFAGNSVKAVWPGSDVDTWGSESGPPKGEIWGYRYGSDNEQPKAGINSWFRVKLNWENLFPPSGVDIPLFTTQEEENRLFEMYHEDGSMLFNGDIRTTEIVGDYDWIKIDIWQRYFFPNLGLPYNNLNNNPLNVHVFIRGESRPWKL